MFQFPGFALPDLCIQSGVTLAGRVSPFRDLRIKAYCQLPAAYRRLSRLSSPVIAKASTTCTYSLDPITLSPRHRCQGAIGVSHLCPVHTTSMNRLDTIKTHDFSCSSKHRLPHVHVCVNHFLYFFQIFKELLSAKANIKASSAWIWVLASCVSGIG